LYDAEFANFFTTPILLNLYQWLIRSVMECFNKHLEPNVLMRVYSTGNAPWDSDDNMAPVIADDPLLKFGNLFCLFIYGTLT